MRLLCLFHLAHVSQHSSRVTKKIGCVGVLTLPDCQSLPVQPLCLFQAARFLENQCQVVKKCGCGGVLSPQHTMCNCQRGCVVVLSAQRMLPDC